MSDAAYERFTVVFAHEVSVTIKSRAAYNLSKGNLNPLEVIVTWNDFVEKVDRSRLNLSYNKRLCSIFEQELLTSCYPNIVSMTFNFDKMQWTIKYRVDPIRHEFPSFSALKDSLKEVEKEKMLSFAMERTDHEITFERQRYENESYVWKDLATSFKFRSYDDFYGTTTIRTFTMMDGFKKFYLVYEGSNLIKLSAVIDDPEQPDVTRVTLGRFAGRGQAFLDYLKTLLKLPVNI